MSIYRGEKVKILFSSQDTTGSTVPPQHPPAITPTANFTHYCGVLETATLPDPNFDWQPFWILSTGTQSRRTASQFYRGNANFTAALGDIVLLNGKILHLPIGTQGASGTVAGTLFSSTITNAEGPSSSTVTIEVGSTSNLTANDYVRIGAVGAANVEYRQATNVVLNTSFDVPALTYYHPAADPVVEVTDILDAAAYPGDTTISVTTGSDWAVGDYVGIEYGSARSEIRRITADTGEAGVATLTFASQPLSYYHPDSSGLTALTVNGDNTVTHTAYDTFDLPEIAMNVGFYDDENTIGLVRRWLGGKVNTATITAREGDLVRMSLGEIIFRAEAHNQSTLTAAQGYNSGVADIVLDTSETDPGYYPTLTLPSTQPYYFSYGALTLRIANTNYVVARVRSFDLSINNNIEQKRYVASQTGNFSSFFAPYELREGRKTYELGMVLDLGDEAGTGTMSKNEIFRDLMRQQFVSGNIVGLQATLVLTRPRTDVNVSGTDTITITLPPATPAAGLDTQGCVIRAANYNMVTDPIIPVNVTMIAPRCTIATTERNSANTGENASYPFYNFLYL